MWTKAFWLATLERVVRGAASAVGGAYLGKAFDVLNPNTWQDIASIAAGGALTALVLCLGGNAITKTGPSFNNTEVTNPPETP